MEESQEELVRVPVLLTEVELIALSEFFGPEATMPDEIYDRLSRKWLMYAAAYGLYDDELGFEDEPSTDQPLS